MKFLSFSRLFKALGYSWDGLRSVLKDEAAFQLELFISAILLPVAFCLHVSRVEHVLLISSLLLVLIVELLNTAIEALTDRISAEPHPLSKKAKDAGSAAVLLSLILAGVIWGSIVL